MTHNGRGLEDEPVTSDDSGATAFDPSAKLTPYEQLAEARNAEQSVFELPDYSMWCVTRYGDVVDALSDHQRFSSANMVRVWAPPPETAPFLPDGHPLEGAPVSTDPPRHTRIRKLVQKAFTPKVVADRTDDVRGLVERVLDGFVDRGSVDLVSAYCAEIPPAVVAQLLGVPEEDSAAFRDWALDAHHLGFSPPTLPDDELLRLSRQMVDFDRYVRDLITARRADPREDLTTYLVHATGDEGEPSLTDRELVAVIASMVTAGSDTTSTLIGHCVYVLLARPDIRAEVEADHGLIDALIEETLRVYPSARAMRRTTRCPVHIGGAEVPENQTMFVHLGSANRDPEVFEDPNRFDIHRPNAKRHMSFGTRTHFCLGAPLARLEARQAITALLERVPTLRLAEGETLHADSYDHNMFIPSLVSLRVEWDV